MHKTIVVSFFNQLVIYFKIVYFQHLFWNFRTFKALCRATTSADVAMCHLTRQKSNMIWCFVFVVEEEVKKWFYDRRVRGN